MDLLALMYVAVGGALGSMARFAVMSFVTRWSNSDFPFGTMTVNILGSFFMGMLLAAIAAITPAKARDLHLLLAVGVMGGFTTFSAFSVDIFLLIERGALGQFALYTLGSVFLSLLALVAGMWVLRSVTG